MTISQADIDRLDQRWDTNKLRTLIHGEATVTITDATGRQYDEVREGRTAYELRTSALDRGNIDDILDPLQLDIAIKAVGLDNPREAAALHLASRGVDIEAWGKGRLLDRGIELVRQHEGGRATERANAAAGEAVCWRCMEAPAKPGELCRHDCDGLTDRKRRQLAGLLRGPAVRPYDPTEVADPAMMTEAEIEAEIAHLASTQGISDADARGVDRRKRDAPIAGGSEYAKRVVPYGTSPDEISGEEWSQLP
jgi:hypothetical protein